MIGKHTSPMRNSTPSLHTCLYLNTSTERSQMASMRHLSPYGTPFGSSYLQFTWMSPFAGRIVQFSCCSTDRQFLQCCNVSVSYNYRKRKKSYLTRCENCEETLDKQTLCGTYAHKPRAPYTCFKIRKRFLW